MLRLLRRVSIHPPLHSPPRVSSPLMGKSRKNKSKEIFPDDDSEEFAGAPSLERRDEPAVGTSVVARDAFRFSPDTIFHTARRGALPATPADRSFARLPSRPPRQTR